MFFLQISSLTWMKNRNCQHFEFSISTLTTPVSLVTSTLFVAAFLRRFFSEIFEDLINWYFCWHFFMLSLELWIMDTLFYPAFLGFNFTPTFLPIIAYLFQISLIITLLIMYHFAWYNGKCFLIICSLYFKMDLLISE